jgi:hypothetical protein
MWKAESSSYKDQEAGIVARPLTIIQRGAVFYAVCARCNGRLESKYLDLLRATEAIRSKYESHVCRAIEERKAQRDEPPTFNDSDRACRLSAGMPILV